MENKIVSYHIPVKIPILDPHIHILSVSESAQWVDSYIAIEMLHCS